KSVSRELTYNRDTNDLEELRDTLLDLSSDVGRMAREENLAGRVIHIKIRLKNFETHTCQRRIDTATSSDRQIFHVGWELFETSGFAGLPIRLIGIGLSDLVTPSKSTDSLFETP